MDKEEPVLISQPEDIEYSYWKPKYDKHRGTILIVHANIRKANFRFAFESFVELLTQIGFGVMAFDYGERVRKNADLDDTSLRFEAAKLAIPYLKILGLPPFSVLGIRKGTVIALQLAIETNESNFFDTVILVAPSLHLGDIHFQKSLELAPSVKANFLLIPYNCKDKATTPHIRMLIDCFATKVSNFTSRKLAMGQKINRPKLTKSELKKLDALIPDIDSFFSGLPR